MVYAQDLKSCEGKTLRASPSLALGTGVWRNWLARIVWDDEVVSSSLTTPTHTMPSILKQYKKRVDAYLLKFLSEKTPALAEVNSLGSDLIDRIKPIVAAGKTIRGSLALLSYCF